MASDSSRRRQDAPRPTPAGARPHPRSAAVALAVAFLAIAVVPVASFAAHLETATRGPEGVPTWRWNIASSTLEPRLRADGSVALLADGQPSGLVIPAVTILDAGGRSVTPVGTEWSVRQAAHGWLLQLVLDDSSLPLPYT